MSSSIPARLRRSFRFDTGFVHLRATVVATATVLGSYGMALVVEHFARLRVDTVIQAVVIASAFARAQRSSDWTDRLLGCLVLPVAAAGATELSTLIVRHPDPADVLFTLGVAGSIWVRRFGPRATRAGTLVVLPLIAVLVVSGQSGAPAGHARTGWSALIALIAAAWGSLALWIAERTGFAARSVSRKVSAARAPTTRRPGLSASTRMALQMAVALGSAFAAGRALWPDHWAWVVLTAFIVCSGARGRGDVLLKGSRRAGGAAVGTVVAGLAAGAFGPRSDLCVVLIFTALALATWLRELSYAYWAGCVTAVLSLLYDWFGQSPGDLLRTRLAGIALGALLGVAASWLVLPVRTGDVVRARTATAVAALSELLDADWSDPRAMRVAQLRLGYRTEQLELAVAALRSQRLLPGRWRGDSGRAAAADALHGLARPVAQLVDAARESATLTNEPETSRLRAEVAANALAVRKAIGHRPGAPRHPADPGPHPLDRSRAALTEIDHHLATLTTLFGAPPPPLPPPVASPDAGPGGVVEATTGLA